MLAQLYAAMVQEESDHSVDERHVRQVRRPAAAPSPKDIEQDSRIRALERENQTLKAYVAGLLELLVRKGAIEPADIETLRVEAMSITRSSHGAS